MHTLNSSLPARLQQLLLLLAARAMLPELGAYVQLARAKAANGGVWPLLQTSQDVSCGAEIGHPEISNRDICEGHLPPNFVYLV